MRSLGSLRMESARGRRAFRGPQGQGSFAFTHMLFWEMVPSILYNFMFRVKPTEQEPDLKSINIVKSQTSPLITGSPTVWTLCNSRKNTGKTHSIPFKVKNLEEICSRILGISTLLWIGY